MDPTTCQLLCVLVFQKPSVINFAESLKGLLYVCLPPPTPTAFKMCILELTCQIKIFERKSTTNMHQLFQLHLLGRALAKEIDSTIFK